MLKNKWKLFVLIAVILVFIAAVLFFFLFIIRPSGSVTHPWLIPKAYRRDVGQQKTISFVKVMEDKQTVNQFTENDYKESITFVYVYDPVSGTGRLGIVDSIPNASLCTMTIYEPEWQGGEGLVNALTGDFSAKIIHRFNMDFMEGEVYLSNAAYSTDKNEDIVCIDPADPITLEGSGLQYYLGLMDYESRSGYLLPLTDEYFVSIIAGTQNGESEDWQHRLGVFLRIVERFDLHDEFGIEE